MIDLLIRAGTVHTLGSGQLPQKTVAVRNGRIVATSADPHGLDEGITSTTAVVDAPEATVLPAFFDTHTHLTAAADAVHDVVIEDVRSIQDLLDRIRARAVTTKPGEWIRTATRWQETQLAERRLPTLPELDQATGDHPVLLRRGGHSGVANSLALRIAGITAETPQLDGGRIEHDAHGHLTGRLDGRALTVLKRHVPELPLPLRIDGLRVASHGFAATGLGTVRECGVPPDDLDVLKATRDNAALGVRVHALVSGLAVRSAAEIAPILDAMRPWKGAGDPWLRVWGVKFGIDGGADTGALERPYASDPTYRGELLWEQDELVRTVERVVRAGWPVGTHAWGDRALRILLDVYEQVLERNPGLPARSLVIEHGGLAYPEQRARAIRLGIPITVQHPLLHDLAPRQAALWGADRVRDIFPLREWIDEGAEIAAGSDHPIGPVAPMDSVHGMVTRDTLDGVVGPEHAITRREAIDLHNTAAARLVGESAEGGRLAPGLHADLTLWSVDPLACDIEELAGLRPELTLVGGIAVHDPHTLTR